MTLAEVLLALGLCVVVILSLIALAIAALRSNNKSSDSAVAEARANRVLDEFIYGLPASSDPFWSQTSFTTPYQQDTTQIGSNNFTSQVYLSSIAPSAPGVLRVAVNTTWQGGQAGAGGQGLQVVEIARILYAQ